MFKAQRCVHFTLRTIVGFSNIYLQNELIVLKIILVHSLSCASVIIKGGARRIMSPWVGFANKPLSRNRMQTSVAVNPNPSSKQELLVITSLTKEKF